MKLAVLMLVTVYVYLLLRVVSVFPHHSHSSIYFAIWMAVLTAVNLVREWKDHRHES